MLRIRKLARSIGWVALAASIAASAHARKVPTTDDEVGQVGGKLPGNPSVQLVKVADGFNDPINVTNAGDGSGRIFVVERVGRVKIVTRDGKTLKEPFIDLTKANPIGGDVQSQFIEQGLYAIAFHPNYKQNGYFYVHYASLPFNGDGFIVRFKVSAADPNKADMKSAKVIMRLERPYYNHNGGQIAFGPDGFLYISSGDGGWEGDVLNAGQSLDTLLAKMLRIDVNVEDRAYSVPPSNPFAKKPNLMELFGITEPEFDAIKLNAKPEIWAYGIRNSWMFHFDPRNGDLFMAEVGQNHWEEINYQPASSAGGENYGWARNMGTHCHPLGENKNAKSGVDCNRVGVLPAAEYSHDVGCSVIGFGVAHTAGLNGAYVVGDWCSGRVWGLGHDGSKWQFQQLMHTGLQFTGGGYDEDGNVLATHCNCFYTTDKGPLGNPPGAVWKVVAADKVPAGAVVAPAKKN